MTHISVLLHEAIDALNVRAGGRYLDLTAGGGGHTAALLETSAPDGRVFATDADAAAVARVQARLAAHGDRVRVAQCWIDDVVGLAGQAGFLPADGALADLGLSSFQLDQAERGFAFMREGPLDMRFDATRGVPASAWLDAADLESLTQVLREYGEVANPRRVAQAILDARPITTTTQLRDVVAGIARADRRQRIHPATLVFQALRIVINDELTRLTRALPAVIAALAPGGRLAVITFHSLEDRIVKQAFRDASTARVTAPGFGDRSGDRPASAVLVTRKPVSPSDAEIAANPRARSAQLRVLEKVGEGAQ